MFNLQGIQLQIQSKINKLDSLSKTYQLLTKRQERVDYYFTNIYY